MGFLTEKQLEIKRKYREANREKVRRDERERQRIKRQNFPELYMLAAAKSRAKRFGLPFDLTIDDIVVPEVCPILNIPLRFNFGGKYIANDSPSLDKLVPFLGYTRGNVRVISHKANRLKSDLSVEEINRLAKYVNGEI